MLKSLSSSTIEVWRLKITVTTFFWHVSIVNLLLFAMSLLEGTYIYILCILYTHSIIYTYIHIHIHVDMWYVSLLNQHYHGLCLYLVQKIANRPSFLASFNCSSFWEMHSLSMKTIKGLRKHCRMRCQKQRMTQKVRKLNSIGPSDSVMPKAKVASSGDKTSAIFRGQNSLILSRSIS